MFKPPVRSYAWSFATRCSWFNLSEAFDTPIKKTAYLNPFSTCFSSWLPCAREFNKLLKWFTEITENLIKWIFHKFSLLYLPGFYWSLTLSWRRSISYRNQSSDLQSTSMELFLYDIGLHHERVKLFPPIVFGQLFSAIVLC